MSDEIMADAVTEAAVETPEVQDVKTFTQEELDRIVADRVARTKRQYDKKLDGIDLDEAKSLLQRQQEAEIEKQKERGEFESILRQTVEKKDQEISTYKQRLETPIGRRSVTDSGKPKQCSIGRASQSVVTWFGSAV